MARGKGSTLQCENLDSNRCHWLVAKPIPTHHPSNASFSCNLFGIMPHQVASANAETWQKHENCPERAFTTSQVRSMGRRLYRATVVSQLTRALAKGIRSYLFRQNRVMGTSPFHFSQTLANHR